MKLLIALFFASLLLIPIEPCMAQLTWKPLSTAPTEIRSFAVSPDGTLYAVSSVGQPRHQLFISNDHGATWTTNETLDVDAVSCDSTNGVVLTRWNNNGLYYRSNGSSSWTLIHSDTYGGVAQCTRDSIYLVESDPEIVSRSGNGGLTWIADTLSQDNFGNISGPITGPNNQVVILLRVESWFELWNRTAIKPPDSSCLFFDNSPPTDMFFGRDGYIYFTGQCGRERVAPDGDQWEVYHIAEHGDRHYAPMASLDANTILSVDTDKTFASTDHGDNWTTIGTGIPDYVASVFFTRNELGYALTANGSLYEASTFADVRPRVSNQDPEMLLVPNPAQSSVQLIGTGIGNVRIYNLLGVLELQNLYSSPTDNPSLDIHQLPAGIYKVVVTKNGKQTSSTFVKE